MSPFGCYNTVHSSYSRFGFVASTCLFCDCREVYPCEGSKEGFRSFLETVTFFFRKLAVDAYKDVNVVLSYKVTIIIIIIIIIIS